jgi:hypothetical protein
MKGALKQNNEIGGVKKLFLRKDLLQKVKQHDRKLSDVLQTFQVCHPITIKGRSLNLSLAGRACARCPFCATHRRTQGTYPSNIKH